MIRRLLIISLWRICWLSDDTYSSQFELMSSQTRVYDNDTNPCGPVYITIGDGGNREGLALK